MPFEPSLFNQHAIQVLIAVEKENNLQDKLDDLIRLDGSGACSKEGRSPSKRGRIL